MLRAVSTICLESRALELVTAPRRDLLVCLRRTFHSASPLAAQTVLSSDEKRAEGGAPSPSPAQDARPPPPPPPPPPHPHPPRVAWPAAAAVVALTASVGGIYLYQKLSNDGLTLTDIENAMKGAGGEQGAGAGGAGEEEEEPVPAEGAAFPEHVEFLLVGAGTASFAAMRAIRSLRPGARVLLVGSERALPYMRPPLSKELWREPDLARRALTPDALSFRQWNGKRRPVVYEPEAFYAPVGELAAREHGGASVARGWTVTRLDVRAHTAELRAPRRAPVTLRYDRVLVATGARARRVAALGAAAARGRSLALRGLRDASRLAAALDDPRVRTVAVVGGGFLATELSAALADRLRAEGSGRRVVQVVEGPAPMASVLPLYLARDAARRLADAGVTVLTGEEVVSSSVEGGGGVGVSLQLSGGGALACELVVECVGAEPDAALADASALEVHPELGGILVNAEMQARADVWAAGDAACFYDVVLGRRRVEHHDHAVVSGRLAGENMAAPTADPPAPAKPYTHQSMFWSDLGPQLGYEAIGIIDSRLPTVGVFSADAVTDVDAGAECTEPSGAPAPAPATAAPVPVGGPAPADARRYDRGVVFYLRERRVVGVLLWNLFNRMHTARQVVAQGEFDDLLEVGKLFAPHDDE